MAEAPPLTSSASRPAPLWLCHGSEGAQAPDAAPQPNGRYRLAGRPVLADRPIPQLAAFAHHHVATPPPACESGAGGPIFEGLGWLAGAHRTVRCLAEPDGFRIDLDGRPAVRIDGAGHRVTLAPALDVAEPLGLEALLGPGLIGALSLGGTWCLHASALQIGDRAVLLTGESGAGKSTVARELDGGGWIRRGDDIAPVVLRDQSPRVLPHFPQLKLPADRQPAAGGPESLPLAAVLELQAAPPTEPLEVTPLRPAAAAIAIVRHTVAARLFDPLGLSRHLELATHLAGKIPVLVVRHPHRASAISEIRSLIANFAGGADSNSS